MNDKTTQQQADGRGGGSSPAPGWAVWWSLLKTEAKRCGWPVEDCDAQNWMPYFVDGYGPKDALREDMEYGAD